MYVQMFVNLINHDLFKVNN